MEVMLHSYLTLVLRRDGVSVRRHRRLAPRNRSTGTRWIWLQTGWTFYIPANISPPTKSRKITQLCNPLR